MKSRGDLHTAVRRHNYKRYVDDTFVIFNSKEKANKFLDYINSRHEKIKFTMETESNNKLPFLDLLIKRTDNKIDIEIYRKPTYTGLGVNFMSKCFTVFKNNTFNTMFHRAYHLSSSYLNFHKEILFLKNFFTQNGYLETIFYSRLRKSLNKTYSNTPIKFGPPKLMLFAKLPYFNDKTNEYIKSEMNILMKKFLPQINLKLSLYNHHKIKNFTNHKEKVPFGYDSMVVYKFECPSCQLAYVGSTKETLL